MEELKLLVDMVAHLPTMALWVLAGYWIYKLAIIGSIYSTIKFVVLKTYEAIVAPKTKQLLFDDWVLTPSSVNELRAILNELLALDNHFGDSQSSFSRSNLVDIRTHLENMKSYKRLERASLLKGRLESDIKRVEAEIEKLNKDFAKALQRKTTAEEASQVVLTKKEI